jgi:asparagine synthase (glutamine-hydrolysing)
MWGICGEIRFDGRAPDWLATAAMTRALTPRGPDGEGLCHDASPPFGHRRLAVIDVSDAGAQPTADGEWGG